MKFADVTEDGLIKYRDSDETGDAFIDVVRYFVSPMGTFSSKLPSDYNKLVVYLKSVNVAEAAIGKGKLDTNFETKNIQNNWNPIN